MTRRLAPVAAVVLVLLLAAGIAFVSLVDRRSEPVEASPAAFAPSTLILLDVRTDAGPLLAVVGSSGTPTPAAVVIPSNVLITIPGQGDGTTTEAALLPGRDAATSVANLLGVWVPHYAVTDAGHLARVVDRVSGIDVLGQTRSGGEVAQILSTRGAGRPLRWREVIDGLLAAGATWQEADLLERDDPSVPGLLTAAVGGSAQVLPTEPATQGLKQPDQDAIVPMMVAAFGAPDRTPIPVVVLNGSGVPGVGEPVAERLVPAGFRIVVNGNASSFDHDVTLIVAGTAEEQASAERVRELLGVGEVSISGIRSGLGDVTIVVGKDFQTG